MAPCESIKRTNGELSTVVRGKQSLVLGKSIRGLCLQRLGGIIAQFPEYPYQPWLHVVYVPAPAWLCVLVLVCGCVGVCECVCQVSLCVPNVLTCHLWPDPGSALWVVWWSVCPCPWPMHLARPRCCHWFTP